MTKYLTAFRKKRSGIDFMVYHQRKVYEDGVEVEFDEEKGASYMAAGHLELADKGAAVVSKSKLNKQEVKPADEEQE